MEVKELYDLFDKKYQEEVKPYIAERFSRDRFSEPIYHILDNFRLRRFRSAFPLLFAESYNKDKRLFLPVGAASELIFAIALVQDDIIDRDEKRGDIPASHAKFGQEVCIAASDYVYADVMKMLSEVQKHCRNEQVTHIVLNSFIDAHRRLYRSFIAEKLDAGNLRLPLEKILETYKDKTVQGTNALFCSALLATEDNQIANQIKEYCYDLAIAGQIKNDIYDATSYLGNRGYSDLENGYITYVIRKLIDSSEASPKVLRAIKEKDDDILITELKNQNIISLCIDDCNRYAELAISKIVNKFPKKMEEILLAWAEGNRKFSRRI